MLEQFRRSQIAQHDNIIVTKDLQIKLVDYDWMYIPPFKGMHSSEKGHPFLSYSYLP